MGQFTGTLMESTTGKYYMVCYEESMYNEDILRGYHDVWVPEII